MLDCLDEVAGRRLNSERRNDASDFGPNRCPSSYSSSAHQRGYRSSPFLQKDQHSFKLLLKLIRIYWSQESLSKLTVDVQRVKQADSSGTPAVVAIIFTVVYLFR